MDIDQGLKDEGTIEKKSQNKLPAALFPQRQLTQAIAFTLWSIAILQSTHNTLQTISSIPFLSYHECLLYC